MNSIKNLPDFITEFCSLTDNLYRLGWDERNGGNISAIITQEQLTGFIDINHNFPNIQLDLPDELLSTLSEKIFLITASGAYFRNVSHNPQSYLGIIKINKDKSISLLWGFENNTRPTSELPSHLMSHAARLSQNLSHRIIIHSHPTNLIAMTNVCPLEDKTFSVSLWRTITECMVVFPEGVGVIPWMVCGNEEIALATAEKIKTFRLVVWPHHGAVVSGNDIDEAFGILETVEKAAELYMKTAHLTTVNTISDIQLGALAKAFNVTPHPGYLDI